jgi:hypothetical protein
MKFIDLQDETPKRQGTYKVKIKTTIGMDRECDATWSKRGFLPINERLLSDEYVYSWYKD